MIKNNQTAGIIFILLIALVSCSEKSSQLSSDYSHSLINLKNASNVQYKKLDGIDQVTYKIIKKYPATETINELNKRLKDRGWKPLERDWLNPEIPTSHVRGWTNYVDGTENPNLEVHSWSSDWINDQEDILIFNLKYRYPVKTVSNMLDLNVNAIYVPEKLAKATKSQINDNKKSLEK